MKESEETVTANLALSRAQTQYFQDQSKMVQLDTDNARMSRIQGKISFYSGMIDDPSIEDESK